MDKKYFKYFDIVVVSTEEESFRKVFAEGYRSADMIDQDRRDFIKKILFYLNKPHSAIMYAANVEDIITDPDEQEKDRTIFDGLIKAMPIIRYRGDNKSLIQGRRYTNALWIDYLENRRKNGKPYAIEDLLNEEAIIEFLKRKCIITETDNG